MGLIRLVAYAAVSGAVGAVAGAVAYECYQKYKAKHG